MCLLRISLQSRISVSPFLHLFLRLSQCLFFCKSLSLFFFLQGCPCSVQKGPGSHIDLWKRPVCLLQTHHSQKIKRLQQCALLLICNWSTERCIGKVNALSRVNIHWSSWLLCPTRTQSWLRTDDKINVMQEGLQRRENDFLRTTLFGNLKN